MEEGSESSSSEEWAQVSAPALRLREQRERVKKRVHASSTSTDDDDDDKIVVVERVATKRVREERKRSRHQPKKKKRARYREFIEDDTARSKALSSDKAQLVKRCAALNKRTGTKVALVLVPPKNPRTGRTPEKTTRYFGCTVADLFRTKPTVQKQQQ